jgi:hypothetical protein
MLDPKDLIKILDSTQKEFEEFCDSLAATLYDLSNDFSNAVEEIALEIEENLNRETDDFWEDIGNFVNFWVETREEAETIDDSQQEADFEAFIRTDLSFDSEFDSPKLDPNSSQNPACIGCRHYHGKVYRGNLLVCAMHPYGWDDLNCPDWET